MRCASIPYVLIMKKKKDEKFGEEIIESILKICNE